MSAGAIFHAVFPPHALFLTQGVQIFRLQLHESLHKMVPEASTAVQPDGCRNSSSARISNAMFGALSINDPSCVVVSFYVQDNWCWQMYRSLLRDCGLRKRFCLFQLHYFSVWGRHDGSPVSKFYPTSITVAIYDTIWTNRLNLVPCILRYAHDERCYLYTRRPWTSN